MKFKSHHSKCEPKYKFYFIHFYTDKNWNIQHSGQSALLVMSKPFRNKMQVICVARLLSKICKIVIIMFFRSDSSAEKSYNASSSNDIEIIEKEEQPQI